MLPDYNEAAEWHLHLPAKTKIQINIVFIDLLLANFISEHTCVEYYYVIHAYPSESRKGV